MTQALTASSVSSASPPLPLSPSPTLLSCSALTKTIGPTTILNEINLELPANKVVVITGRTGAGKSTLLSLLAGLDRPGSGQIRWAGTEISTLPASQIARLRREHIGIVFQRFNLLPSATARQNVDAALLHSPLSRPDRAAHIDQLLSQFNLARVADNYPSQLSVGQQQLAAVARALANNPRLLLADEPTGDVDPQTAAEISAALLAAARQNGRGLLITTHGTFDPALADIHCRLESQRLTLPDGLNCPNGGQQAN